MSRHTWDISGGCPLEDMRAAIAEAERQQHPRPLTWAEVLERTKRWIALDQINVRLIPEWARRLDDHLG